MAVYSHINVTFTQVDLNAGQDYSTDTGYFICRVAGLYFFSVTLTHVGGSGIGHIYCGLYINGSLKLSIDEVHGGYANYSGTASGTFHLAKGDTVHVSNCADEVNFEVNRSTFTGFLIQADII